MKIATLFAAAGIAIATLGAAVPAQARDGWHDSRFDDRGNHDRRWRHNDRRWHRGGQGYGHHRVRCWTEWHRHHRVRVCR